MISACTSPCGQATSQLIGESAISANSIRCTGVSWPSSASSAFLPKRLVVEMMIRLVNGFFPDAVKNESMSLLANVVVGS